MPETLTVHDPRGYPPRGHRQAARAAPAEPRRQESSTSSTACSTTPTCSSSSSQAWFGEHLPAVETRVIRPRESWVDDPEMREQIEARTATPPSSGSASEAPVARRSSGSRWRSRARRRPDRRGAHARVRATRALGRARERHADDASGVRAPAGRRALAGRAARLHRGRRSGQRRAVHAARCSRGSRSRSTTRT